MPRGDPFTSLCRQTANLTRRVAADLHLHTTASDGDYTPSQVVGFARAARLDAIAVTDHDTLAGVAPVIAAASALPSGSSVRIIPGIELSVEWAGQEVHLLGYFAKGLPTVGLSQLDAMCERRRERFRHFIQLLHERGVVLNDGLVQGIEQNSASLGRRHIASLLLRAGIAASRRELWQQYVGPIGRLVVPKRMLPFAEATAWIESNRGVSSLAHPSTHLTESDFKQMKDTGLNGIEVKFPAVRVGRRAQLISWASRIGLIQTGGSDCHGGELPGRSIGSMGVTAEELRILCNSPISTI
jgi:3',5'-nucleoside bisphosphate phosphatase